MSTSASVSVVCLESRDKMLADDEEIEQAQEEGALIDVSDELPKAFVLTEEYGMRRVYLTQLGAATLQRRLEAARDGNL